MARQHHLLLALLLLLVCCHPCAGSFFSEPRVQWTYRLPGAGSLVGRGLRSGNEVISSPDGSLVFATADDGSLHFIKVKDLRNSFVYEPSSIPGTYTECRSGVTLMQSSSGQLQYVVYAVIDVPVKAGVLYDGMTYDPSRSQTLSRLLAVNLDGSLRFSVPLNGAVVGKPVVGADRLYVVHNVPSYVGTSSTRGKITVVRTTANPPTVTASISPFSEHGPFGPPTGTSVNMQGKQQDVVIVAEAWDDGYSSTQGKVYLLRPSALYDDFNGQGNDAYELRLMSDVAMASSSKPSINADATEVFVGAAGSRMHGWSEAGSLWEVVSNDKTNISPSWDLALEANKGNVTQPLLVSPILSSDETLLYQVGASTKVYCIDTQRGDILWNSDGAAWGMQGSIMAEPRLVERRQDQPKVYVIEGLKGRVRQHDALTGAIDWAIDCYTVSGIPCHDAVEADFSVSPEGTMLYYGDVFGKIVALEIADFTTPAPTKLPTQKPVAIVAEVSKPKPEPQPEPTPKPTTPPTTAPVAEPVKRTPSPTISPAMVVPVTAPVLPPVPVPNIDTVAFNEEQETGWPTLGYNDDDASRPVVEPNVITVVDVDGQEQNDSPNSELTASAAIDSDEGDTSFFSNEIMIILVAVCGGLAMAIVALLVAQKARTMKSNNNNNTKKPMEHMLVSPEDDGKDWNNAQDEYEEECRRDEEETLREIVGSTPTKAPKRGSKKQQKRMSPMTPSTLASIEESPAENELSFVSDATPEAATPKKNLAKSFDASLPAEAGLEVTLNEARAQKDDKIPLGSTPKGTESNSNLRITRLGSGVSNSNEGSSHLGSGSGQNNNNNVQLDNDGFPLLDNRGTPKVETQAPPELSSVEVIPKTAKPAQQQVRRTMSPGPSAYPPADTAAANDIMSVDGSLYLDDDSKFDVASLAQYSVASTTDGASAELGVHYPGDGSSIRYEAASPGDQYMMPPRIASPLVARSISPEVADYLKRSQSAMAPNPMTPKGTFISKDMSSPVSTSPMTPPSGENAKEVRKGQSVRPGGSSRSRESSTRGRSPPPPQPPVKDEASEPEDAWSSFLSELANAEKEFFNPSFNKKKTNKGQERAQSPPPPPPPDEPHPADPSAPPPPPPDPPIGRHRKLML